MSEPTDYEGLVSDIKALVRSQGTTWDVYWVERLEECVAALRHAATVEQAARDVVEDGEGLAADDADCEFVGGDTMDALRAALAADGKE